MKDTSGFYKLDGSVLYAPNYALNLTYELLRETKDSHTYPTDGWYWFDSKEDAYEFFGIELEEDELDNTLTGE